MWDLDDCRDPESGDIERWALTIVFNLSTYCEISPSGKGLRLIGYVTKPVSTMSVFYTIAGKQFIPESKIFRGGRRITTGE